VPHLLLVLGHKREAVHKGLDKLRRLDRVARNGWQQLVQPRVEFLFTARVMSKDRLWARWLRLTLRSMLMALDMSESCWSICRAVMAHWSWVDTGSAELWPSRPPPMSCRSAVMMSWIKSTLMNRVYLRGEEQSEQRREASASRTR